MLSTLAVAPGIMTVMPVCTGFSWKSVSAPVFSLYPRLARGLPRHQRGNLCHIESLANAGPSILNLLPLPSTYICLHILQSEFNSLSFWGGRP